MEWNTCIKEWEVYLKLEKNLAKNTYYAYLQDVDKLKKFLLQNNSNHKPTDVNVKDLRNFIKYLNELGLSQKSQARLISGIKSFFKYLLVYDYIDNNPASALTVPSGGRKIPEVLSIAEIDKIIDAIDVSVQLGHRNRAIIEVLYSCGLRVSELINLKMSNIFYDKEFVRVTGKGEKQRLIPFGKYVKKEIQNYMSSFRNHVVAKKGHEDFLFLNRRGRQLTRVMIFTIVKDACKQAGIKKNVSPHSFRHSFATHLIDGGADLRVVQDMLGHESITTTEIYTHIDRSYLHETIRDCHPRS